MLLGLRNGFSGVIPPQESDSGRSSTQDTGTAGIPPKGRMKKDKEEDGCAIRLTTQERGFLADVWKHPASSITDRYRRLGLSPRVGTRVHSSLLASGLLLSGSVPFRKGRLKALCLSEKGKDALGIAQAESARQGGVVHRYWCARLAERLRESGYNVQEEVPIGGGKTIDLVAARDGRRIAIEVETGASDAEGNVRKCLHAGMNEVLVVATSAHARDALAHRLRAISGIKVLSGCEALARFVC